MPSPWDAHMPPTFGQDHVGEQIPNMDIESRASSPDGLSLKLRCPRDNTEFWAQLWKGGQNSVVRNDDQIHAQCPGCGVEWNGEPSRFFAISISKKLGLDPEDGFGVGVVDVVIAKNPYEALTKTVSDKLMPEVLQTGHEHYRGISITEVNRTEYKLLEIKKKAKRAIDSGNPDVMAILEQCANEEAELVCKDPTSLSQMMEKKSGPLDKLMMALKMVKEAKEEQERRNSGGFPN